MNNKDSIKLRSKKNDSNNEKTNNHSYNNIKMNNGNADESKNNKYYRNITDNEKQKTNRTKSEDMYKKNKNKLTEKERDDIFNKLHYDGELMKIKKQQNMSKYLSSTSNNYNNSEDKLP